MIAVAYLRRRLAQIRDTLSRGAAWWLGCTYRAGAATYPRRGWWQAHHRRAEVRRLARATANVASRAIRKRLPRSTLREMEAYLRAWTHYRKAALRVHLKTHRSRKAALYVARLAGVMPVRPHSLRAHFLAPPQK